VCWDTFLKTAFTFISPFLSIPFFMLLSYCNVTERRSI
jgi:hypothetical protein